MPNVLKLIVATIFIGGFTLGTSSQIMAEGTDLEPILSQPELNCERSVESEPNQEEQETLEDIVETSQVSTKEIAEVKEEITELNELISSNETDATEATTAFQEIAEEHPEALIAYDEKLSQEIADNVQIYHEENPTSINISTDASEPVTETATIELSDGGSVEFESTDREEANPCAQLEISSMSVFGPWEKWITQKYGERSHTAKYSIKHVMYPDTTMVLKTYYNLSKRSGITVTSTSKAGTEATFPHRISGTTGVTDKRAEKVGYNVNTNGEYTYSMVAKDTILHQREYEIRTTITLKEINTDDARVYSKYYVYN